MVATACDTDQRDHRSRTRRDCSEVGHIYQKPEKEKTMTITITTRSDDYHVCINGNTAIWGCGKTINEAIGDALRTHATSLGINVKFGDYETLSRDDRDQRMPGMDF